MIKSSEDGKAAFAVYQCRSIQKPLRVGVDRTWFLKGRLAWSEKETAGMSGNLIAWNAFRAAWNGGCRDERALLDVCLAALIAEAPSANLEAVAAARIEYPITCG